MNIFSTASSFAEPALLPEHLQEWLDSGVDPEIIRLNVYTVRGGEIFEFLRPKATATQSGTGVRAGDRKFLDKCLESVGWECNGRVKPTAGPLAIVEKYFCKKSQKFKKRPKYYQPLGIALYCTFLRASQKIWQKVAERYGVEKTGDDFWAWVRDNNIPIVLVEGEKKAGCLLTRGYAAISVPGINSGYRVTEKDGFGKAVKRALAEDLLEFNTPGREITFTFDYREGDYFQSVEFKAARTTAELLQSAIAKIAQLPGPQKGIDDFAVAGGDVDAVMSGAPSLDEIQKIFLKWLGKENKKKAWALTYPIAWECNQRRLDISYPSSGLICIKSPKDTGKTYALKQLAAKAQAENRKVLVVTHRIVLGRAICEVVQIPWIEEMNSDGDRKIEGKALGYGLCIDSLHPTSQALFYPTAFEGALVIFDEVEQIFWHTLNSSTCRENRQAILSSLKTLIQTVLKSGGQILIQDADLSDISIDFVREFAETNIEPWVAVNCWQPSEPWKIKFYDTQPVKGGTKDDPSGLLKDAVDRVNAGGKIWVSVDSQKARSKHGTKNLEKYFKSRCPGKKILRIDAETVANPEHEAYQCAEIINGLVAHYDIVICSPSLATGVSVDLRGHFTDVFGIYQGAISDNEVRQSLARVREPVNRFVWCRQIAVGKIGNGESNYKSVAKSTEKDVRYNLQLLKDFDFDLEKAHNPVVLKFWAKYAARINSSIRDFRETVREGLEAEGHIITDCPDDDRDTSGEIKALRIIGQVEEAEAVAEAIDIDRKEFEQLEQKRSKTDAERYQEEKFRLGEIYKTKVTPELRQLHQNRWFGKIQSHYLLTHKKDFVWMRDRKNIDSQIKSGGGQLCLQDVGQLTGKVTVHRLLNTKQFCDPTKEWSNKSPEVLEFVGKALFAAADIKILTGIKVSPEKAAKDPIGVVGSFLAQLGLKLTSEQRRVGKERVRFYKFGGVASAKVFDRAGNKIGEPQGLRSQIFDAWEKRDELALFEFLQKPVLIPEPVVTPHEELALNQGFSNLEQKNESVTPETINKLKISAVTTDSSIGTPIEPTVEPQPEPAGKMGWVSRWGKWVRASFVAATDGAQIRILIQEVTGWNEVFAWPHQLRWDEGQA